MTLIPFNINNCVRVKITDYGMKILEKDYRASMGALIARYPYEPPKQDENGWSKMPLWVLMKKLGPHCGNGYELPFETTIEFFEVKDE